MTTETQKGQQTSESGHPGYFRRPFWLFFSAKLQDLIDTAPSSGLRLSRFEPGPSPSVSMDVPGSKNWAMSSTSVNSV